MKNLKNYLENIQIANDSDKLDGRRYIQIVALLSKFLVPVAAFLGIFYFIIGIYSKGIIGVCVAAIFYLPIYFIKKNKIKTAKLLFLSQFLVVGLTLPIFVGRDACTEWLVIIIPAVAYLLFPRNTKIAYLLIGLFGYIAIKFCYFTFPPIIQSHQPEFYRFFLAMTIMLFLFWIVLIFENETTTSEKIIQKQHLALLENQEKVKQKNDSLTKLNFELQQFAHHASHDMREPLRTISSFATLLSRRLKSQPEEKELLGFIEDGAKRMNKMLEDLINFARAGVENEAPQPVNLAVELQNVQKSLALKLEETDGQIVSTMLPTILAHQTLVTQLLQNLIGNSLKYHRAGTPPRVDLHFFLGEKTVTLVFRDNGLGMEKQYLSQIFEPFRRLHGLSEFDGSGIGLATCRKIVEFYDGKIWAESELGVGSAFFIEWPISILVEVEMTKTSANSEENRILAVA